MTPAGPFTATKKATGESVRVTCNFLFMCSGYYSYKEGYTPAFPGRERFQGQIVHPQAWPEDLSFAGKKVVIIGSGATAVTLVPAMADTAAHVTKLQRSPTYVASAPDQDAIANALRKVLPGKLAYGITRKKNVALQQLLRSHPHPTREGETGAPEARSLGARRGLRRRQALHAFVQPVGPAHVPGPEQRSVQVDQERRRIGGHRHDRHLRRNGHRAHVG